MGLKFNKTCMIPHRGNRKQRGQRKVRTAQVIASIVISVTVSVILIFVLPNYTLAQESTPHNTEPSTLNKQSSVLGAKYNVDTSFGPKLIEIIVGTDTISGISYAITVGDALNEFGVEYNKTNEVHPDIDSVLSSGSRIIIYKVTKRRTSEIEQIPFSSITVLDDTRELNTTTIIQTGRTGTKRVVYEQLYRDSILQKKYPVREDILTNPQDEITALGTKRIFRTITIDGNTFSYWKKIRVWATSYHRGCEGCSSSTSLGYNLTKGVIAVDPNVIPLFTNMYVPGYGYGQALDVGGGVQENKIDLGFDLDDLLVNPGQWSSRWVDIYIMD